MIRRKFLGLMTLASAGGLATASAAKIAGERQTIRYRVDGFTCVTCAVGLESLLQREKGILLVKATYPEGLVTVSYDLNKSSENAITVAIESMGFGAHRLSYGS